MPPPADSHQTHRLRPGSQQYTQQAYGTYLPPPLEHLAEAADTLAAYFDRIGSVLGALHASGSPQPACCPGAG